MDNMAEAYVVLFVYGVLFAIVGVISLLQMLIRMALFERAGVAAWKSLIPFYGSFVQHQLTFGESNKWFWFFCFVPYVNVIYVSYMTYAWARAFGRTKGFGVFAVFFPTIATVVLWLQGSSYEGVQSHIFDCG